MSVRAMQERRKKYQHGPVSNPGHPSTTNRKARRLLQQLADDGIKCSCGQCLPGQDRECPLKNQQD